MFKTLLWKNNEMNEIKLHLIPLGIMGITGVEYSPVF